MIVDDRRSEAEIQREKRLSRLHYAFILACSGVPDAPFDGQRVHYRDVVHTLQALQIPYSETDPGDSEYRYLGEPRESDDPDWLAKVQDLQASGIIPYVKLQEIVCSTGVIASSCGTLGTLGGPLAPWGGIVPDVAFEQAVDTRVVISLRVTPVEVDTEGNPIPCRSVQWWQQARADLIEHWRCGA